MTTGAPRCIASTTTGTWYSDPTYDFQIHQWDRRFVHGATRSERLFEATTPCRLTVGGEARYDDIDKVQVDHTEQRAFIDYVTAHSANELSAGGLCGRPPGKPVDPLRVMAGLRAD